MAYVFNWATGEFDEITVTIGVPAPQFTLDGEAEAPMVAVTNGLYSKLLGAFYYGFNTGSSGGGGGGRKILKGQPIPIGMGLTFLYAQDITILVPPVNIKRGQPIPIGMGMTMTYANDVT
ncbi:MAG TPA: hypothetical protein VF974_07595 [Patescibacteria group bacterium]